MVEERKYNIPRVIHFFWFGGGVKPESVEKCITSWKKNCPDFEIREWNESNYDFHKHPYMENAYAAKKWAFVTDYARLDILYQYGGIYLDTDVEVLKDLSPLCKYKAFIGFENKEYVNDGQGIGCIPHMTLIREMMDCYEGEKPYSYIDGKEQYLETPTLRTKVLDDHGLLHNGLRQTIDDIEILPADYLCPLNYANGRMKITVNTYSIHHYYASWYDEKEKCYNKMRQRLNRFFGEKTGKKIFVFLIHSKDAVKRLIRR